MQPKNMRIRRQVDRLSVPKTEYVPSDPFKYSDFRGLLSADYKEALAGAFKMEDLEILNKDCPKLNFNNKEMPTVNTLQTKVLIDKIQNSLNHSKQSFDLQKWKKVSQKGPRYKQLAHTMVDRLSSAARSDESLTPTQEDGQQRTNLTSNSVFPVPKSYNNLMMRTDTVGSDIERPHGAQHKRIKSSAAIHTDFKTKSILSPEDQGL